MALGNHHSRQQWYRAVIVVTLGAMLVISGMTALVILASPATADASVDSLEVDDVTHTVDADGNLTDVHMGADLAYSHDVPDADRRVVELHVGPSIEELEAVTFDHESSPDDATDGTVALEASLFDSDAFDVDEFDPAVGETVTREVVVAASVRVDRADGEKIEAWATETVTVEIHKDAGGEASVGGVVEWSVVEG